MYFQKPAEALTATGSVAPLNPPAPSALPPSRSVPQQRSFAPAPATLVSTRFQPNSSTSQKQEVQTVPVPDQYVKLPDRQNVFLSYDNLDLEKAIMDRLREELRNEKKYTPDQEKYLVFPPLPVISPPGVAYVAKTTTYPRHLATLEPDYVVHRRLHFEERNAERQGWDLGPMQTLISAMYFWKDTLLLPQSLASGVVHGFWDTSAGKCLPGSPSPYYLYPPGLTLTGTLAEAAVVTGAVFVFP